MQQDTTKQDAKTRKKHIGNDILQSPIPTLGVRELAQVFLCSEATIRTIRSRTPEKLPPAITIGRKKFWLQETVRAWLLERQEKTNEGC